MKILFFVNTDFCTKNAYNGGGWISSICKAMSQVDDIELTVGFFSETDKADYYESDVRFCPIISNKQGIFDKIIRKFSFERQVEERVESVLNLVNRIHPDIINIYGTEKEYGLITEHLSIPVLIHLQGILTPYLNAFFPPAYSYLSESKAVKRLYHAYKKAAQTEKKIFSMNYFFSGRTEWDYSVSQLLSPKSRYFVSNEILRDEFYSAKKWTLPQNGRVILISTISPPIYKGLDLIIKTANILYDSSFDFEWRIFGLNDKPSYINEVDRSGVIQYNGVASAEELIENFTAATFYVHPSYIENSPNSVCEAQMIGLPVISTDVGGVSSLIENKISGFTVPANDPYRLAFLISKHIDFDLNRISQNAIQIATKRHDKDEIILSLLDSYNKILNHG